MHLILFVAKRLGIGQQRVGGVGLLLFVAVGIPLIVIAVVKIAAG